MKLLPESSELQDCCLEILNTQDTASEGHANDATPYNCLCLSRAINIPMEVLLRQENDAAHAGSASSLDLKEPVCCSI